jgi:hypothetical protein
MYQIWAVDVLTADQDYASQNDLISLLCKTETLTEAYQAVQAECAKCPAGDENDPALYMLVCVKDGIPIFAHEASERYLSTYISIQNGTYQNPRKGLFAVITSEAKKAFPNTISLDDIVPLVSNSRASISAALHKQFTQGKLKRLWPGKYQFNPER